MRRVADTCRERLFRGRHVKFPGNGIARLCWRGVVYIYHYVLRQRGELMQRIFQFKELRQEIFFRFSRSARRMKMR